MLALERYSLGFDETYQVEYYSDVLTKQSSWERPLALNIRGTKGVQVLTVAQWWTRHWKLKEEVDQKLKSSVMRFAEMTRLHKGAVSKLYLFYSYSVLPEPHNIDGMSNGIEKLENQMFLMETRLEGRDIVPKLDMSRVKKPGL